jgi:hypothetical protein
MSSAGTYRRYPRPHTFVCLPCLKAPMPSVPLLVWQLALPKSPHPMFMIIVPDDAGNGVRFEFYTCTRNHLHTSTRNLRTLLEQPPTTHLSESCLHPRCLIPHTVPIPTQPSPPIHLQSPHHTGTTPTHFSESCLYPCRLIPHTTYAKQ